MIDKINVVIQELQAYLEKPVIYANQNRPKPEYPFLTYSITATYIKGLGREIREVEVVASESEIFDYDIEENIIDQAQFTVSVTAYGDNPSSAMQLSIDARDFINGQGRDILRPKQVVIVEVGNITNRDTLLVDDYERRSGFDVRFRVVRENKFRYETIEEANINKEE